MTQATSPESGLRNHRVEFVREDTVGEVPADPSWNYYSDNLATALVWEADAQIEAQEALGSPDPNAHFAGPEDHTASIEYHLQNFFVDDSGNPLDASGDAVLRGADNDVLNTHTVVDRRDDGDKRSYTVLKGAHPNLDEIAGDPGTGLPMTVSLEYEAKKGRSYVVDQPDDAGETLTVVSTDDSDTSQTLRIESDGGTTNAQVDLNGTTEVTTTDPFSSIDAFELDDDTTGDVTIEDSDGNILVTLYGANSYDGVEGDLGVPALGSGTHASDIGTAYERFLDDSVEQGASALATELRSATLSVTNNYDKSAVAGTKQQAIHQGQRDIEFTATTAGRFESHDQMAEHLQNQTFDLTWTLDGGTITLTGCSLTDAGEVGPSADDVISTTDNTFVPTGIDVSAN